MKDQLVGKIMTELVVRAKMYAYRMTYKKVEEKRCKGTAKCVVDQGLTFDDYRTCLFHGETIYREQMMFENKKHKVYTVNKHKIALNRDNDKRLVQADGITTVAGQGTCNTFGLRTIKNVFHNLEILLKIFTQGVYILCSNREHLCSCF